MKAYRLGSSWGVTIVRYDQREQPDEKGRRPSDRLMGLAQNREYGREIVEALNASAAAEA